MPSTPTHSRHGSSTTISPSVQTLRLTPGPKRPPSFPTKRITNDIPSPTHHKPVSSTHSTASTSSLKASTIDPFTGALEFEGLSFLGDDGTPDRNNVTDDQQRELLQYLDEKYNAVKFVISEPFLIIGFDDELPEEHRRPFTIAGLVALWELVDNVGVFPPIGLEGEGKGILMDLQMYKVMEGHVIPPDEVILYLAKDIFKDCIAISTLWRYLVVELPQMSDEDFFRRLEELPAYVSGMGLYLCYYNGPLAATEMRERAKTPKPKVLSADICDNTDYVEQDGKFYPGSMIYSVRESKPPGKTLHEYVTSGILVEKDGEQRLTCSFHPWQRHFDENPAMFGATDDEARENFKVIQGQDGTNIGFVCKRFGKSDVALAQLNSDIVFENKFMDMDYVPKTFIRSQDQRNGDYYIVDGFSTGQQKLYGQGRRFEIGRVRRTLHFNELLAPENGGLSGFPLEDVPYISLRQGVCATSKPINDKDPKIRDSVCGSVLLRCQYGMNSPETEEEIKARGEICGMMHLADLEARYSSYSKLFVFADAFDDVIDDGWKIVQVPEETTTAVATEEVAAEDPEDGSPAKKQRLR